MFEDSFLIADIRMEGERPSERWFWFDPPFNPGRSALLHKQPDHVWRLDFQLGWGIDKEDAIRPENVEPYVRGMLGPRHRVHAGMVQHLHVPVPPHGELRPPAGNLRGGQRAPALPFGARGCNGGVADADNLGWKLDLVMRGEAPGTILASYDHEAIVAADENILQSTRSTDFLTPKNRASQALRDGVLDLAGECPFAARPSSIRAGSPRSSYPDSPR